MMAIAPSQDAVARRAVYSQDGHRMTGLRMINFGDVTTVDAKTCNVPKVTRGGARPLESFGLPPACPLAVRAAAVLSLNMEQFGGPSSHSDYESVVEAIKENPAYFAAASKDATDTEIIVKVELTPSPLYLALLLSDDIVLATSKRRPWRRTRRI